MCLQSSGKIINAVTYSRLVEMIIKGSGINKFNGKKKLCQIPCLYPYRKNNRHSLIKIELIPRKRAPCSGNAEK